MKRLFLALFLIPGLAFAVTPAFVKSTTIQASTTSPVSSNSITPTTAGDSVIALAFASGTGSFGTPTNSVSSVVVDATTAHFEYIRVQSCLATAQTFSVPFSGFTEVYVVVQEVTPGVTFDQNATENSGTSTSPVSNSLTPTANDEFLLAGVKTTAGAITFSSWTNSFTQDRQLVTGPSLADAYFVQTTGPTSINAGVTISSSESWFAELAAYTVASASCTHDGYTSGGALAVPNGSSGSYWLKNGTFGTPNCSSTQYWQPTLGNFGVN
jgi:hypothetical protein